MISKYKQVLVRICCAFIIPLVSIIHIALNIYRDNLHNIGTKLDEMIPFVPVFALPYLYWFIYISIGLLYFAFVDGKNYFRLLSSIVTGMCLCFVIFYFYPTVVPRPYIGGNSLLENMVGFIYSVDNPYNCFPSIHVLNSMLVTLFIYPYNKNFWVRSWSVASCISIILSTLLIKQHFVLDAVAGILLSTAVYLFFTNEQIWKSIPAQKFIGMFVPRNVENNPDTL